MELYRRFKREQLEKGNMVLGMRDELGIRRTVGKELFWLRQKRRQETGNHLYKLSYFERKEVADNHRLQMADGRILMPDREALVRDRDGREFIVKFDALTRHYSQREIHRKVSSGCRTGMAKNHSGAQSRHKSSIKNREYRRLKKPDSTDIVSKLLRGIR
jgi:hypothetical protein